MALCTLPLALFNFLPATVPWKAALLALAMALFIFHLALVKMMPFQGVIKGYYISVRNIFYQCCIRRLCLVRGVSRRASMRRLRIAVQLCSYHA